MFEVCQFLLNMSFFSKIIGDTELNFSEYTIFIFDLSNEVSHIDVAQSFIISTCLRYVDIFCFCQFSRRLY